MAVEIHAGLFLGCLSVTPFSWALTALWLLVAMKLTHLYICSSHRGFSPPALVPKRSAETCTCFLVRTSVRDVCRDLSFELSSTFLWALCRATLHLCWNILQWHRPTGQIYSETDVASIFHCAKNNLDECYIITLPLIRYTPLLLYPVTKRGTSLFIPFVYLNGSSIYAMPPSTPSTLPLLLRGI